MNKNELKKLLLGKGTYSIGFLDDSLNIPILLGFEEVRFLRRNFQNHPLEQKARALYEWVSSNISYGDKKRKVFRNGYRSAKETLLGKEGVCGEMAYLYVAAARSIGLKSNYVNVEKDFRNQRVSHACAGVYIPHFTLVDIAYHTFDIKHKKFDILNDSQMLQMFNSWR